jgi:hypothetical protein
LLKVVDEAVGVGRFIKEAAVEAAVQRSPDGVAGVVEQVAADGELLQDLFGLAAVENDVDHDEPARVRVLASR